MPCQVIFFWKLKRDRKIAAFARFRESIVSKLCSEDDIFGELLLQSAVVELADFRSQFLSVLLP
ncbi:hypothetical protein H6F67_21985 [Microcoleus sp. FACHB-1515]|uniref:hypothetical protein n=1 Tax=Cyanophyceae TaxID=3028117 RepID=UPI0016843B08|nr:hypothetical protein [Microcoleus sp. FACHB-1515]MBD2092522.1 hypothetical protein [Microcoleus sp. FACHB-1515]